jgi:sugar lactone lactonase YvrE
MAWQLGAVVNHYHQPVGVQVLQADGATVDYSAAPISGGDINIIIPWRGTLSLAEFGPAEDGSSYEIAADFLDQSWSFSYGANAYQTINVSIDEMGSPSVSGLTSPQKLLSPMSGSNGRAAGDNPWNLGTIVNNYDQPIGVEVFLANGARGDYNDAPLCGGDLNVIIPLRGTMSFVYLGQAQDTKLYRVAAYFLDQTWEFTYHATDNATISVRIDSTGTPVPELAKSALTVVTVAGGNGRGSDANQLDGPNGVAVDAAGNLYVLDANNNRVQKWAPNAAVGVTVAGGNGRGPAATQLNGPTGLTVDAAGNVYVADAGNFRVQKWAPGANSGTLVAGGNGPGPSSNQFSGMAGVAVDNAGNTYVADSSQNRVQKWPSNGSSGTTVAGAYGAGKNPNQINQPYALVVDGAENLYIADFANSRVQKWTPNATSGETVAGGNGAGSNTNQVWTPYGLAVDAAANIYVSEAANCRAQKWAPNATAGQLIGGGNPPGAAPRQFNVPMGLAVDTSGNVYVADSGNNRVQKLLAR